MKMKIIEIRDRATVIPAFAIHMIPDNGRQLFLYQHCGYRSWTNPCILLVSIEAPWHSARSWDEWNDSRTMSVAHKYIEENFDSIDDCAVIDIEFILHEKDAPCKSIREEFE